MTTWGREWERVKPVADTVGVSRGVSLVHKEGTISSLTTETFLCLTMGS